MNEHELNAARDWISACMTGDEDFEDVYELTSNQLESMIRRYYDGGIEQFLIDANS
jgi:hypothetical protein